MLPLSFALYRDRFGSWGGMSEEPESFHLQELLEEWELRESRIVETGPLRAGIWLRFDGAASHLELTLRLEADSPVIRAELLSALPSTGHSVTTMKTVSSPAASPNGRFMPETKSAERSDTRSCRWRAER